MTNGDHLYASVAQDTMDEILAESDNGISPTLTPFVALGSDDPADELIDGPTTPAQAAAKNLWETFGGNP